MSCPANGYSVGNLATTTISGTVLYKGGVLQRNTQIHLYIVYDETPVLLFTWFLKDCTIYDNSSVTFTGIDAMAFTNNEYEVHADDTIGMQFSTAISTITRLCGTSINIDRPNSATVDATVFDNKSSWTIKSLMEETAKIDCGNYYTQCSANSITLAKHYGTAIQILSSDDYAPLSKGVSQIPINFVRIFQADMEIPTPNTDEGETLADYGIFEAQVGSEQPTIASTMKIVTPLMSSDIGTSGFVSHLTGKSFGTQFSCASIKTPSNSFMTPMAQIIFGTDYTTQYYLCSADYFLTTKGIYASISGTTKSLSDYEYVGETTKSMRKKVELEHNYSGTLFSVQNGLTWQETERTVQVNSG